MVLPSYFLELKKKGILLEHKDRRILLNSIVVLLSLEMDIQPLCLKELNAFIT
jgi:hypothetical protein